ncbi:uncharacterized protein Z520_03423 [Fonsecaea multimorphosa CBS 102226]|uniref:Uncharacterized protein n=1 Tax=Fonsecaea multimorphosa CBS 102226 TaxID=1442371 RepID=A0A0D2K4L8_9EURO|nr:uncharacterized protein Z520_03423 [Fonsecaea multimorphosa CBS 102226]KIY00758.1 hypothetical protein Z520_03423 [Fonsecaea multimorphosa CBS 102226]OAL27856.1 hypothetical protein AYO22_03201 [Fonsecaea multimorphosa]
MRLLNVETYELQTIHVENVTYAILSHRWYEEEITFETLNAAQLKNTQEQSPQLDKIRGACARAKEDELKWVWIDSCCINKASSQEMNESINSMFQWYQKAAVCYTYLPDVVSTTPGTDLFRPHETEDWPARKYSEWFERGWTLQELLAPRKMKFFDRDWQPIGTRADLARDISRITGIEARYLTGTVEFLNASIATRLSWQAGRRTTKIEDIAYSLVGVLDVQLVPFYGEGRQAFQRLQEEILKRHLDESIFAWTAPVGSLPSHSRPWVSDQWGLLAPSPDCFKNSRDIVINGPSTSRPPGHIQTTVEGVTFPISIKDLMASKYPQAWFAFYFLSTFTLIGPFAVQAYAKHRHADCKVFPLTLNCWRRDEYGQRKAVQVFISRDRKGDQLWRRCRCDELGSTNERQSNATYADKILYNVTHNNAGQAPDWLDITILQPNGVRWPV